MTPPRKAAPPPEPAADLVAEPEAPPVPADELADLTDAQQVELIESTDNGLGADADLPQPGADYQPEAS